MKHTFLVHIQMEFKRMPAAALRTILMDRKDHIIQKDFLHAAHNTFLKSRLSKRAGTRQQKMTEGIFTTAVR